MPREDFVKHLCKGPITGYVNIDGKDLPIRQKMDGRVIFAKIGWKDERIPLNTAAGHEKCPYCGLDIEHDDHVEISQEEFLQLEAGAKYK